MGGTKRKQWMGNLHGDTKTLHTHSHIPKTNIGRVGVGAAPTTCMQTNCYQLMTDVSDSAACVKHSQQWGVAGMNKFHAGNGQKDLSNE